MNTALRQPHSVGSTNPGLALLIDELIRRFQAGEPIDPDGLAGDDPDRAEQLRRLLPTLEMLADLSRSAASGGGGLLSVDESVSVLGNLGDYRIVREIGRGGMGVVYEAEQLSLARRVALKILPFAAAMDSHHLARFRTEAQAAAHLHHTNIVPVFAVGCERGVHYYAMQFIDGRTLADMVRELRRLEGLEGETTAPDDELAVALASGWCTAEPPTVEKGGLTEFVPAGALSPSGPSTRSRAYFRSVAKLAIQAAEALDFAHRQGILHRDIKPANLLVDASGRLWITDFGLARVLNDGGLTMTGDMMGTLRYMSPEQALGKRAVIDERSDLYSLGVTVYELLTLRPAFAGSDRQEILRKLAEDEPRAPRRLNPAIPEDLETVLLKTIAKDPASRYATAQELADDLRRFLENKPVRARRPSVLDHAAKWTRRHTTAVGTAFLILIAAVGALALSTTLIARKQAEVAAQRDNALRHQRRAEENFREAREAVDQMLTEVGENTLANSPRMQAVRRSLLEKALGFYQRFLSRRVGDPVLGLETGRAFRRVGDINGILGRNAEADSAYRRSIALLEPLATKSSKDLQVRHELANVFRKRGLLRSATGESADAEQLHRKAIGLLRKLAIQAPKVQDYRDDLGKTLGNYGLVLLRVGRLEEAEAAMRQAIEVIESLAAETPEEPRFESLIGADLNNMALVALDQRNPAAAHALLTRAITHQRKALAHDPRNPISRQRLRNHYEMAAYALSELGKPDLANAAFQQIITLGEGLLADFPDVPEHRQDLAGSFHNHAYLLSTLGKLEEAVRQNRRGLDLYEGLLAENPQSRPYRDEWSATQFNHCRWLGGINRPRDAVLAYEHAIKVFEELVAANPKTARHRLSRAEFQNDLAAFLVNCADPSVRDPFRAVEVARNAVEGAPRKAAYWRTFGIAQYRAGNWSSAIEALERSMDLSAVGGGAGEWLFLAMARWHAGDMDSARNRYDKAVAWIDKNHPKDGDLIRLRAEAEALIGPAGPAMPNGEAVFERAGRGSGNGEFISEATPK